jgi:hypothetical protein
VSDIYCTSYCNRGHRMRDGKPVQHECYVIPPKALEAERRGDLAKAVEMVDRTHMPIHRGVKVKP